MAIGETSRTEVVPEVHFLGKLVEHVAAGKIRVPRFQRAFVWKQDDLHQLLDSVLNGYPIGSILVWDTDQKIATAPQIGPIEIDPQPPGMIGYLLDGQQRLSTLVGTLRLPEGCDAIVDGIDWRVYFDLKDRNFQRLAANAPGPQYFPVRNLLDTAGFFAACRRIEKEVKDNDRSALWLKEADHLANAFRNYKLPVIHIREADLESAVTVFARLNRTGRKMGAVELVSALTYQDGEFHLAAKLDKWSQELAGQGFGNLNRVFLLRSVLAALGRDIYAKDWARLVIKPEIRDQLPTALNAAEQSIKRALAFLKTLGVTSDRLLPYGLQIVLLGEFFRLCPEPASNTVDLLTRWFWVTSFTSWFGGANPAQAIRALHDIRDLAQDKRTEFAVVDLDAPAQPFPERFDGRSARVRTFLLYLASLAPRSHKVEKILDPGALLSARGTLAVGYIAPGSSELGELASGPANRLFVDGDKSGHLFADLQHLNNCELAKFLPTHGFTPDSIQWVRKDNPQKLIQTRRDNLIAGERRFMAAQNVTLPAAQTSTTIADSDTSEDD